MVHLSIPRPSIGSIFGTFSITGLTQAPGLVLKVAEVGEKTPALAYNR